MSDAHAVAAREPGPMLPVAAVQDLVCRQAIRQRAERISLAAALGRILAQDVTAAEPFPPFAASTKDGYAVAAQNGPGTYPVQGHVMAGRPADYAQLPGRVSYIATGAPLPEGADAIVMVEDTEPRGDHVRIKVQVAPGTDVRPVGADLEQGALVLPRGKKLGPVEMGLLATVGAARVPVYGRPKVTVLSTGDEICAPWETPGYGQIRDSNHIMLSGMALAMGTETSIDGAIAPDDPNRLRAALATALADCDVLITSGGVSMGERDLLPALLQDIGAEVHTERVLMKPGKPFTFATRTRAADAGTQLVFALPGNPASSLVTFFLFVAPALRKMQGRHPYALPRIGVTAAEPLKRDPYRPEYHRVTLSWDEALHDGLGGYRALSTGSQKSSRLMSMLDADALVEIPAGEGVIVPGAVVPAIDLRQL